ncbi:amino acid ABC transporter permease [Paenibacillus jilunlii]|uniref:Cysteine ABC transporter permease n=1 Tax=Paenibacillus jilunlii TaxID=682956 RepID=A0A1G9LS74_9BACL|nr:amino acid ABC transporter permease [Paenibacillus jilunlii]KWX72384.1 cysteine ABC transporter permease [Paenibacillus jilunlii]SDL64799.1 L-cystine transport system permease protein [Paenibacillus jilunlii]
MGAPFDISYIFSFLPKLLTTLGTTLLIVGFSLLAGILVGFLVALPRLYKVPVLKTFAEIYISFFRGTPILIQLFLFYYGLPEILKLVHVDVTRAPVLFFVILTYGLHTGAFMSEMIRASVTAVDRGQVEAAYAAGMTSFQAFSRIVLPQALGIAVPVFSNLVIALLKDTSLAFTLGVMEMTGKAQTLGSISQHFIETYIALALIYLVISFTLEKLLLVAERRLLRHEVPGSPARKTFGLQKNGSYRRMIAQLGPGKGGGG